MGEEGFAIVPILTLSKYLESAYVTKNGDGSVRHYHIHISPPPDVVLKGYGNAEDIDATEMFQAFE
jgi:hypothetical protein